MTIYTLHFIQVKNKQIKKRDKFYTFFFHMQDL
jgi:hypothetical protein